MPEKSSPSSALASRSWRSGAIRKTAARKVSAPKSVRLPPRRRQPVFIDVDRWGGADLVCKRSVGLRERLARVLHDGVDRARRDLGAEQLAHQLHRVAAGDAVSDGE